MKKLFLLLAVLAVPAAAQDQSPFLWRLHPEVGSRWTQRIFLRAKVCENADAFNFKAGPLGKVRTAEPTLIHKMSADWEILSRDDQGNFTARIAYQGIVSQVEMLMNGRRVPPDMEKMFSGFLANLNKDFSHLSLTVKISPEGRVLSVAGMEKLGRGPSKIDENFMTGMGQAILSRIYGQDGIQATLNLGTPMPPSAVEVGRGYSYEVDFSTPDAKAMASQLPFKLLGPEPPNFFSTRVLTSREHGVATFVDSGLYDATWAYSMPDTKVNRMSTSVFATRQVTTQVAEDSGLPKDATMDIRLNGKIGYMGTKPGETLTIPFWVQASVHTVIEPRS